MYNVKKRTLKVIKRSFVVQVRYIPSVIFAFLALIIMFAPYQSDSTLGTESLRSFLLCLVYILSFLALLFSVPSIKQNGIKMRSILMIVPVIIVLILNVLHSYNGNIKVEGLTVVLWVLFCLVPKDVQSRSFIVFKRIWVILCIIGILSFLFYILNVPIPYKEVQYYSLVSERSYISYGLSFIYKQVEALRLCGICNEPGFFGTICALVLCASRMNLRKWQNIAIFMAGLLSFSVAFVLIVIVYSVAKMVVAIIKESDRRKRLLRCLGVFVLVFSYFVVLPNIHTGDYMIDTTINRLTVTSEGLSGDNRTTSDFDELYESVGFLNILFGMGRGYLKENITSGGGNSSYKIWILEYGLIACLMIWGMLLIAILYKNTRKADVVLFAIAFFASLYQRPNIISVPYMVLLLGGVEYIRCTIKVHNDAEKLSKVDGKREEEKRILCTVE